MLALKLVETESETERLRDVPAVKNLVNDVVCRFQAALVNWGLALLP